MPSQRQLHATTRLSALAPLLFGALLATSCSYFAGEPQTAPSTLAHGEDGDICAQQWLLESLHVDGREHKSRMLWQKVWRDRPYLICDKLGFVRGSAGSNPYLGQFELSEDGHIEWLKPPEISRMGDRRNSSKLEMDYLRALPRVDSARLEQDRLVLKGDDGTRIEFQQSGAPAEQ